MGAAPRHARLGSGSTRTCLPRRGDVSAGGAVAGRPAAAAPAGEAMSGHRGVRRAHRMPFGAETRDDGSTGFRLWAPAAKQVELWLADRRQGFVMPRDAAGWAEWVTRDAPAGTR